MDNKHFKISNIDYTNGCLIIDNTKISIFSKHYDVYITQLEPHLFRITTLKPTIIHYSPTLNINRNIDINLVNDNYVFTKKTWTGKTKKQIHEGVIELNEKKIITYITNNIILIE